MLSIDGSVDVGSSASACWVSPSVRRRWIRFCPRVVRPKTRSKAEVRVRTKKWGTGVDNEIVEEVLARPVRRTMSLP